MHKDTRASLNCFDRLAVRGEQEVNTFIREELLAGKIPYEQKVLDQLAQPYHGKRRSKRKHLPGDGMRKRQTVE